MAARACTWHVDLIDAATGDHRGNQQCGQDTVNDSYDEHRRHPGSRTVVFG